MLRNPTVVSPAEPFLLELYAGCADPRRCRAALDILRAEMEVGSVIFHELRLKGERAETAWLAHDSRSDLAPYNKDVADRGNLRLQAKRFRGALGRPVCDEDLFAGDDYSVQMRFQQQLSTVGFGRFLGGAMALDENRFVAIALHRDAGDTRDYSDRQKDRLWSLLPHLGQAAQLIRSVAWSHSAEALLRRHLDHWACGLIICDELGHVLWLNQTAQRKLSSGDILGLRDGALHAYDVNARSRLMATLERQAERSAPGFLALESDRGRCQLALERLEHPNASGTPQLLIMVTDDEPRGAIPAESLAAFFDLTEAESRLTSALVAGATLEEYAQRRGVGLGTVRYQLKQVLAKTGARRQADLVRRILCSAAAHVAESPYLDLSLGVRAANAIPS